MAMSNGYLKPELQAQIGGLGLRSIRMVEGTISGIHRSPLHGLSPEFSGYREYAPGDDTRNLDWRAYARSDRFYIKRFEDESNLRAHIVLDASRSMAYGRGDQTKYDYAATLAASLASLLLKQRDAVGLVISDRQERVTLRPRATQSQLTEIVDLLEATQPEGETEVGRCISMLADRIKGRGMIILISDLLTPLETLSDALGKLQYFGHEILLFHVLDKDELELPFNDSVLFRDIEGTEDVFAEPWAFRKAYKEAMQQFLAEVQRRCSYCGIDYLLLTTRDDLGDRLSHFLHARLSRGDSRNRGTIAGLSQS
jgi:uncharacterized protein (DUF58 family)